MTSEVKCDIWLVEKIRKGGSFCPRKRHSHQPRSCEGHLRVKDHTSSLYVLFFWPLCSHSPLFHMSLAAVLVHGAEGWIVGPKYLEDSRDMRQTRPVRYFPECLSKLLL